MLVLTGRLGEEIVVPKLLGFSPAAASARSTANSTTTTNIPLSTTHKRTTRVGTAVSTSSCTTTLDSFSPRRSDGIGITEMWSNGNSKQCITAQPRYHAEFYRGLKPTITTSPTEHTTVPKSSLLPERVHLHQARRKGNNRREVPSILPPILTSSKTSSRGVRCLSTPPYIPPEKSPHLEGYLVVNEDAKVILAEQGWSRRRSKQELCLWSLKEAIAIKRREAAERRRVMKALLADKNSGDITAKNKLSTSSYMRPPPLVKPPTSMLKPPGSLPLIPRSQGPDLTTRRIGHNSALMPHLNAVLASLFPPESSESISPSGSSASAPLLDSTPSSPASIQSLPSLQSSFRSGAT
jgi:hypothetical protein